MRPGGGGNAAQKVERLDRYMKTYLLARWDDRIMITPGRLSNAWVILLAAAVLAPVAGCGAKSLKPSKVFSLDNAWPFDGDEDEPEEGTPVRIVGAWTDTVKSTPGQPPQRGFGGRLLFYGAENDKPILVDGQLVVYAFDEAGREPTDNKPTRRYVFPPDQMKLHMSKNDLGASYSFWLPWDEAGGPKADVSLICRFEPKGGAVVTSEQTRHVLPGAILTETPAANASAPRVPEGVPMRPAQMSLENYQAQQRMQSGVQTAGYQAAVAPPPAAAGAAAVGANAGTAAFSPDRQLSVTSIPLPNDFQLPEGTQAQPLTTAAGQASAARPMQQPAPAAAYQLPYQQLAAPPQPVMQTVQPPVLHGAAVMQQSPALPGQLQPAGIVQRPMMTPIAMQGINAPQNQSFTAPQAAPQVTAQQAMMMQTAQPMMPQAQMGAFPQPQMAAVPMQQMPAIPAQQMGSQQGYQQLPSPGGVRTTVSYGPPATTAWR